MTTRVVIDLRGDIDAANVDNVAKIIADARRPPGSSVVVDMANVTFMDVRGMRVLLEARQALAAEGVLLRLQRPPQCVRLVLELTGVLGLFTIDD
jgi:anti-anti-sigma factor